MALAHGFAVLGLAEIVSFTTVRNLRSRRVMERIGMRHDPADDFDIRACRAVLTNGTCSTGCHDRAGDRERRSERSSRPIASNDRPQGPTVRYSISSYNGSVRNSANASCVLICFEDRAASNHRCAVLAADDRLHLFASSSGISARDHVGG